MKRIKKTLKGKGKIVAALAVVISFASVIAWYTSMNAHAFGTYSAGGNKHFEEGHLTVTINGPDGKSDSLTMYIHSDDYAKTKKLVVKILRISNIHTLYHTILVEMVTIAFR